MLVLGRRHKGENRDERVEGGHEIGARKCLCLEEDVKRRMEIDELEKGMRGA